MFLGKDLEGSSTRVGSGLTYKHCTWLERLAGGKHFSLRGTFVKKIIRLAREKNIVSGYFFASHSLFEHSGQEHWTNEKNLSKKIVENVEDLAVSKSFLAGKKYIYTERVLHNTLLERLAMGTQSSLLV